MSITNLVVLRGCVSSPPRRVELPSGSTLCQLEVTTRTEAGAASVPVSWLDPSVSIDAGDEIVVVGHVRRRWFRAGGATASRTEVVAAEVLPARRSRSIDRALERAAASILEPAVPAVRRPTGGPRGRSGASG